MKSYTVFLDTGVSVEPTFDMDVDTVEGYAKLKEYAKKKLLRMLEEDQFDITYEEHDDDDEE